MNRLKKFFWFLLATLFLIEAWLWDRIQPVIHRLVEKVPLRRLKAVVRWLVARLPAWGALLVVGLPAIVLVPAKLIGLWLLARGQFMAGLGLFIAAKAVGFAMTVFLFELCRPKLMEMAWFARVYTWFEMTRAWARAQIEPAKRMIAQWKSRVLGSNPAVRRRLAALRRWRRMG